MCVTVVSMLGAGMLGTALMVATAWADNVQAAYKTLQWTDVTCYSSVTSGSVADHMCEPDKALLPAVST